MQKEKQKNKIFQYYSYPEINKDVFFNFISNLEKNSTFLFIYNSQQIIKNFEINFFSEKVIKKLNLNFRNIDSSTDVLSFNAGEIGEIDLCEKVITNNAKLLGVEFSEELFRCIIHGSLHILGYDHINKLTSIDDVDSEEMFVIQEKILRECLTK